MKRVCSVSTTFLQSTNGTAVGKQECKGGINSQSSACDNQSGRGEKKQE